MRIVMQKSWRQASLWPMQNTLIIWLTSPFLLVLAAFFVFVLVPVSSSFNPGASVSFLIIIAALVIIPALPPGDDHGIEYRDMALLLVPWLLKTLFDVETIFSMSSAHIMNNTFFAVVCSLSYLCLDPLMKASYCLRCFYGESLQTGEDLKVELRSSARPGVYRRPLPCCFSCFGLLWQGSGRTGPQPPLPIMTPLSRPNSSIPPLRASSNTRNTPGACRAKNLRKLQAGTALSTIFSIRS